MSSAILRHCCRTPAVGLNSSGYFLKLPIYMPYVEQVRTAAKKYFYRPSERLRLIKHGYQTRLKTPGGRAILMRRILKGRFVLSH